MTCVNKNNENSELMEQTRKHPCYSAEAHGRYARMHLPVAPSCNVQCNYCNRKFDCVNESRPGVTSEVLTPDLAREKFKWVQQEIEDLSVVGIAGPGDALANWNVTKETIRQIQKIDDQIIFCLSTNGLQLPEYAAEIVDLGIHHVTVTMNAIDPQVSAQIYQYVLYQGQRYEGVEAGELLLRNQLAGIEYLTKHGVLVKVNMVMVKGINDQHIPAVVKKVKELGVFVTNIMPLIPAPGSAFEHFPQTSMREVNELRKTCQLDIQQMWHCQQCRADAIGRLKEDRSQEFRMCKCPGSNVQAPLPGAKKYKIAVTSKSGKLVDQHFGHAAVFTIYEGDGQKFQIVENRPVDQYCSGIAECGDEEEKRNYIIKTLQDCDAVLTMRIGYHAKQQLEQAHIYTVEFCDSVENGLHYTVQQLNEQANSIEGERSHEQAVVQLKRKAN